MKSYFKIDLGMEPRHGYVAGGQLPETDRAYSALIDIGFNRHDHPWRDESPHLHTASEEYFIVLHGCLDFWVNGQVVSVLAGQLLGIRANVPHQTMGGKAPLENFFFRVPAGGKDKVILEPGTLIQGEAGFIQFDLHQPHSDYLLGACLPLDHPNYSPLLDFTCVWDVDPAEEWRSEQLHYHSRREEFYCVLKGRLDFEVGDSILTARAGEILGVRPGTRHKVVGGQGPVDVLFVRVPGGRGDKIVVGA